MRQLWFWSAPVALLLMVTAGDMTRVSALAQGERAAVTVVGPGGSPSWSPSGAKLAYWTDGGLAVRDMATGQHMAFGGLTPAQGHAPVWLPDESGLLVVHSVP